MFRIKKLDIFITKQFGLLFIATFFICQFVLMMQFLWRYVDELIGKGLSMEVLAQFFWYMGLMLMPQAFPLAILLSSLISFGNLGESSELTAVKAAGISLMQSMRSLIVIVTAIACMSFYFQEVIGPYGYLNVGGNAELRLLAVPVVHRTGRIAHAPSVGQRVAHRHSTTSSRVVANYFDIRMGAHHNGKRIGSTKNTAVGQHTDALVPPDVP